MPPNIKYLYESIYLQGDGELARFERVEELAKIASTLRRKEEKLKDKADQLERRLEMSESTCSRLMEENGELKIEIDSMEIEINEVGIQFPIECKRRKKIVLYY